MPDFVQPGKLSTHDRDELERPWTTEEIRRLAAGGLLPGQEPWVEPHPSSVLPAHDPLVMEVQGLRTQLGQLAFLLDRIAEALKGEPTPDPRPDDWWADLPCVATFAVEQAAKKAHRTEAAARLEKAAIDLQVNDARRQGYRNGVLDGALQGETLMRDRFLGIASLVASAGEQEWAVLEPLIQATLAKEPDACPAPPDSPAPSTGSPRSPAGPPPSPAPSS